MYPYQTLSIGKVIQGLSKTLNIINQAIPLYTEVKPIIKNASSILNVFKEMNKIDIKKDTSNITTNTIKKIPSTLNSNPTFFQ